MSDWYILDENKQPVKCNDHVKRSEWIASVPEEIRTGIGCTVAKWEDKENEVSVSTVFLSMDHGWNSPKPIVFETMIFGGERDEDCERYATWDEAEKGHAAIVESVKAQFA